MYSTARKASIAALTAATVLSGAGGVVALEPANLQTGPLFYTPTLDIETYYTDNLWLTNTDEKDSWVAVVKPRIQAWLQDGINTYSLTFELADSRYAQSGDDDFTDYTTNLDLHYEFNAKNRLNLFGEYYDGHEQRGTGFIEGDLSFATDRPVEYKATTAGGDYSYGGIASRGRLTLAAKTVDYEYGNYRDLTRYRDRTESRLAATLFWRMAPRTDALLETRYIDNDYDRTNRSNPAGSFNSNETDFLLGIAWEASGRTTGKIKLGLYNRDYDSGARKDDEGFLWEVGVSYALRSYSTLDLQTRRFYQETTGFGDGINTREMSLSWNHNWNQRATTGLSLVYSNEDYEGATRKDDTYMAEARYDYGLRRWAELAAGYRWKDRDSDINSFSYTGNVFFLEANLSM